MATIATRTRSRATQPADDEDEQKTPAPATAAPEEDEDEDEDEDDEEEEPTTSSRGRVASYDDDDDDDLDDDDDIVISEGWDEAVAPSGEFPMVDRGTYVIKLADTEVRKAGENAKNPGSKYGVLVFKIEAEDNPSKMEEDAATVTIWQNLFFTPKALGRSKKFVSGMGVELRVGDKLMQPLRDLADEEARFEAIIGIEKYRAEDDETGKMVNKRRNRILRVLGPTDL